MSLVSDFNEVCINKMIINQIVTLAGNQIASLYFDRAWIQPLNLYEPITIPVEIEGGEFIFTSHTCIINQEMIMEKLGYPCTNMDAPKIKSKDESTKADENKFFTPHNRDYNFVCDEEFEASKKAED